VNHVLPELRYRRTWLLLGFAIAAAIAAGSLLPSRDLPDLKFSDKLQHLTGFLVLAFWFGSIVVRRDFLWLGIALLLFGGLIELVQWWMGMGRQADWNDVAADGSGIALGLLIAVTPLGRWARWFETLWARVCRS
jgi:VanZ family protein